MALFIHPCPFAGLTSNNQVVMFLAVLVKPWHVSCNVLHRQPHYCVISQLRSSVTDARAKFVRQLKGDKGGNLLIHVIRSNNHYDYVKDFMLDSLIDSQEVIKFQRSSGWVTPGIDPVRRSARDGALLGLVAPSDGPVLRVLEPRRAVKSV